MRDLQIGLPFGRPEIRPEAKPKPVETAPPVPTAETPPEPKRPEWYGRFSEIAAQYDREIEAEVDKTYRQDFGWVVERRGNEILALLVAELGPKHRLVRQMKKAIEGKDHGKLFDVIRLIDDFTKE